jgi:phosphoglycolate phosphatase
VVNVIVNDKLINDVDLIIFDRDGTLIDLFFYWGNMVKKRAALISTKLGLSQNKEDQLASAMGVDLHQQCIKPDGPVGIKKREIVMQAAIDYLQSIGCADSAGLCAGAFQETDDWSNQHLEKLVMPIDGLYALFNDLVNGACKIAVATTDRTQRAKLTLEYLKLADKVSWVIGADGVKNTKPAPDMINFLLQKLNAKPLHTLMVGDAVTDIVMGRNAGVKASIAVCSGINSREMLACYTDNVVDSIAQIKVL